MTPQAVKAALESLLVATLPDMPTAWGNVTFDPKVNAVDANGDPVAWVRPAFRPGKVFEGEKTRGGLCIMPGAFIVQIFTPKNTGEGEAMEIANTIKSVYHDTNVGGVECGLVYYNNVGESAGATATSEGTDGLDLPDWYQVNVIVPWWAWIGE